MWTDGWVGLPYVDGGRGETPDCFGLFMELSKARLGRTIPDHTFTRHNAVDAQADQSKLYEQVAEPIEGDALVFNFNGNPVHVGYCVDEKYMLHSELKTGSCLVRWDQRPWASRFVGAYRFVG